MKINLSRRIALLVAILILIVTIGTGLIEFQFSSKVVLNQTEEALLEIAQEGVQHIEASIDKDLNIVQEVANKIKTMSWESQRIALRSDVERLGFLDMAVVTPEGTARFILSGQTTDLSAREYISKAFDGEANISNVLVSKVANKPVVMYAAPISQDSEVVAVLIGCKDGTALNEITDEIGFGKNGYAYIMGTDGTLYAHPDRENVLNQRNVLEDIESNGEFKDWGLAIEKLGVGNKGVVNYKFQGSKRYIGIVPMPSTGWLVGIGAYESDVLGGLNHLKIIVFIGAIVFMVLGILAALFLGRSISKPIIELSKIIERIANYDITVDENSSIIKYLKRKDEIGDISNSLLTMKKNLINLVKNISNSSQQVASSSEELTATSQQSSVASEEVARAIEDIAAGASDQAKDTENGAMHIEELGKQIVNNQVELESLNHTTEDINTLKDEGLEIIKDLVEKTNASNKSAKDIHEIILNTNASAEKIESASQMIKSIAEQTNLLALNAAIEAARAGEAGRGFSVVAEEIRKLAEESNRFTEEISEIIQELAQKTRNSVNTMEEVGKIAQSQTESVGMTNDKFEGIAHSIDEMKELITSINESSEKMEVKKDEIISVIQNLSAISEENAAGTEEASASVEEQSSSVEEIANASEGLAELATEMQEMIAKIKY